MNKIFILSGYPAPETLKDGMFQRIKVIDDLMGSKPRVYLNIDVRNSIYKKIVHSKNVEEIQLNSFLSFLIIFTLMLRARIIFSHSIHPFKHIPYCIPLFSKRKTRIILDAHGIVPEEIRLYGKKLLANYLELIERWVFLKLDYCICVSDQMMTHYSTKHQSSPVSYELFSTSKLLSESSNEKSKKLKIELGISDEDCVFIYSGNTQLWQNIPMMLQCISQFLKKSGKHIFLTGDIENMQKLMYQANLNENDIILRSVAPSELSSYYEISHYGFILRDDIQLNRVSNPTKMLEYLQFGLIPIVLSPNIGDYFHMGYQYQTIDNIQNIKYQPIKSEVNKGIALEIVKKIEKFDLNHLLCR